MDTPQRLRVSSQDLLEGKHLRTTREKTAALREGGGGGTEAPGRDVNKKLTMTAAAAGNLPKALQLPN